MGAFFRNGMDRGALLVVAILVAVAILVPVLNLYVAPTSPSMSRAIAIPLIGKYLSYALLALSVGLIWGYCGILSLGHGAFFALGGYAMGMYLMRQIGTRGVYGNPDLPDFMVFLNWQELPYAWYGFEFFPYAMLMVLLVPGVLAFVFGWFAFRSRVTGVYLSIITQAMTFALMLGFFRNNFGFGGNNGLTDFKDILGFNIQAPANARRPLRRDRDRARHRLHHLQGDRRLALRQGAGRDPRRREPDAVPRLPGRELQARGVDAVGLHGGRRRRALRAAGRHHQSRRIRARELDRGGDLGRGRRTRHAGRADRRRDRRQLRQDLVHHRRARAVLAVRPRRPVRRSSRCSCPRASSARSPTAGRRCRSGGARPRRSGHIAVEVDGPPGGELKPSAGGVGAMHEKAKNSLLYLDGVSVSFDGFKALNELSMVIEPGEMRAIIGPNGAGKTTMMDVVTGKTKPDSGEIYFNGTVDLTRLDEAAIAQLGIGRKFQKPTVFESHTVVDNLDLALAGRRDTVAPLCSAARRRRRQGADRGIARASSASPASATCRPPISATARSSGWRSACCSPRSRSCSSSTSRPPA